MENPVASPGPKKRASLKLPTRPRGHETTGLKDPSFFFYDTIVGPQEAGSEMIIYGAQAGGCKPPNIEEQLRTGRKVMKAVVGAGVLPGRHLEWASFSAVSPHSPTETPSCDSLSLPGHNSASPDLKLRLAMPSFTTTQSLSPRHLNHINRRCMGSNLLHKGQPESSKREAQLG